jgi:hypothetical protein
MRMTGVVVRVTEEDIDWLRGVVATGLVDRESAARIDAWFDPDNPGLYELEDASAGVHLLLSGIIPAEWGLSSFLANRDVGESISYRFPGGVGRVFSPSKVEAIAAAIESMSAKVVRQRLEGEHLRSLQPFAMRPLDDEDKEWLLAVLQGLMVFVRRAADDRVGLLVVWSSVEPTVH